MNLASVPRPAALAPLVALALTACAGATTPVTGILAPRVSEGQEIRAGQRAAREATRTLGLVADQDLQDYVQQIGMRLAAESDRSQLAWTFRVVDDPMPNAFGLPGGYVFITRGLLAVLGSEAELAAVIAHEIGHINARHRIQTLARQSGPELGLWAVSVPELRALDGGAALGAGLLFVEHRIEDEQQADDLAFRYALAAGYDVREMSDVFSALGRIETMGGQSALPPWLITHPDPGQRMEAAARRAAGISEPDSLRQHRVEYLDQIEDLAYGQDPRLGFLRGSAFVHPDLRFRVDLPAGWHYRNLAQAVVATTPDRDAALQLTIIEAGAAEAAEAFIRQHGVRPAGDLATDAINGNLVLTRPFQVTTGAGIADGVASWVRYGGRTYQIVSLATSQDANGHGAAARGVARSFAAVNDPRLLELRPNRINIVRLGRATTFDEFSRRYPSAVDAEEIALLNRIAGGSTRLRPGWRIKRVVKG